MRRLLLAAALALVTSLALADSYQPPSGGGGGSGVVSPGSIGQLTQYGANGTTVSGLTPGAGVLNALQQAIGSPAGFSPTLWTNPVQSNNASGENTTGQGAASTGSPTALTLAYNINLVNGDAIAIAGAGAAGATLQTTVSSGGGTTAITLGTGVSTTVTAATVYRTGSISSSVNPTTLTTSTSGWAIGEGIDVAGAGTAGADLITSVTGIGPGTLTLSAPAVTTVTNAKVNFDDTAALTAALQGTLRVQLPLGQFNITSPLTVGTQAVGQWLQGSGSAVVNFGTTPATGGGSTIWNRGSANNSINVVGGYTSLMDFTVYQAPDITATAGYGVQIGNGAATATTFGKMERVAVVGTSHLLNINQGVYDWVIDGNVFYGLGSTASPLVTINNPQPYGDIKWTGNEFANQSGTTNLVIVAFTAADTDMWVNNKFNGCGPCITNSSSTANNQNFVGNSFEGTGTSGGGAMVQISNGFNWTFSGNQFGLDAGNGVFNLASPLVNINIVGNIMSNQITGTVLTNTTGLNGNLTWLGNAIPTSTPSALSSYLPGILNITPPTSSSTGATISVGLQGANFYGTQMSEIWAGGTDSGSSEIIGTLDVNANIQTAMVGTDSTLQSPLASLIQGFASVSGGAFYWTSSTNLESATVDTTLSRSAAGVVQFGTTTKNALGQAKAASFVTGGAVPSLAFAGGTCAGTVIVGGSAAGAATQTGVCAVGNTMTLSVLPSQAHGYACKVSDLNTPAALWNETSTTATTAVFTLTGTTGATDVDQFFCMGY